MKLLIAADMEGITGVVDWNHVDENHREYARFRRLMTEDINAAIRGAFAGGADEVIISDGHGPKTNILIEAIDPRARLNSGTGPLAMVQGIASGVDAAFFIGYHARAGAKDAILCHTVSGKVVGSVWLNGVEVGEIGLNAAVCAHFNAPLLLLSGDQAACAEAREFAPGCAVVETKRASRRHAAELLPPEVTHPRIAAAAETAVRSFLDGNSPQPVKVETPVNIIVQMNTPAQTDRAALIPGVTRLDGVRLFLTADSMPRAYLTFRLAVMMGGKA